MSEIKPNHICKNPECRKEYYACNFCDRNNNWRSVACSFSCYQKYTDLVIAERSKGKSIVVKPERIDMTEIELETLMDTPVEVVLEQTKEELSDYADVDGNINFTETIDEINKELDKKKTTSRSKKKISIDE